MSLIADDHLTNPRANLSNWRTDPFHRWAFREILPVAGIAGKPGSPLTLPSVPRSLNDFALRKSNGGSIDLSGFLRSTATDALVILHNGQIVFEYYAHGNDAHTPHILMSATKAIVGLVAGILQKQGKLDIEALASDYVPEIAATAYHGATVRHLLDMRTGVVLGERELKEYDAAVNWDPFAPGDETGLHAFFEKLAVPGRPHGGPFSYVSANTDLLGWVMERATGRSFADIVSESLWQPIGAVDEACITVDRAGAPRCAGGLCATARDFARIGHLVALGGGGDKADVLPTAWIDDIAENGDREAWKTGEWGQAFAAISPNMSYRSGWYSLHDEPKLLFAMGVHGQNLFVDRRNQIVVAKLSSQPNRIDYRALPLTHRAVPEFSRLIAEVL
jgi:CubicO group peptidase (beta-lactamase class C family)